MRTEDYENQKNVNDGAKHEDRKKICTRKENIHEENGNMIRMEEEQQQKHENWQTEKNKRMQNAKNEEKQKDVVKHAQEEENTQRRRKNQINRRGIPENYRLE